MEYIDDQQVAEQKKSTKMTKNWISPETGLNLFRAGDEGALDLAELARLLVAVLDHAVGGAGHRAAGNDGNSFSRVDSGLCSVALKCF
jgi:hypothetical protein